jgi:3-mercaptopyruvate sulfurtransferase SseA
MRRLSTTSVLLAVLLLANCQNLATPPTTEGESIPTTPAQVPRIEPQELKEKLELGEDVIVVDARSLELYNLRHIPGAVSIPLAEVEERYSELPQEGEIVLYCT